MRKLVKPFLDITMGWEGMSKFEGYNVVFKCISTHECGGFVVRGFQQGSLMCMFAGFYSSPLMLLERGFIKQTLKVANQEQRPERPHPARAFQQLTKPQLIAYQYVEEERDWETLMDRQAEERSKQSR